MTAPQSSPNRANLNQLRRGTTYDARTAGHHVTGEYLGMEMFYDERAILLRHDHGTESIPVDTLVSIRRAA